MTVHPVVQRLRAPGGAVLVTTMRYSDLGAGFLADWDGLDAQALSRPCPRAMATSGGVDGELRVIGAWQGDALVGVWPLVRTQVGPVRQVVRAGGAAQVYDGPTLARDVCVETLVHTMWRELLAWGDVDVVQLAAFASGSPLLCLGEIAAAATPVGHTARVQLDVGSEGTADDVELVHCLDEDDRWDAVLWMLRDDLQRAEPSMASEQLLSLVGRLEALDVLALKVDGEPVAVQLGLADGDTWVALRTELHPELTGTGLGGLLALEVATWCMARGTATFDFAGPFPPDTPWLGEYRQQGVLAAAVRLAAAPVSQRSRWAS